MIEVTEKPVSQTQSLPTKRKTTSGVALCLCLLLSSVAGCGYQLKGYTAASSDFSLQLSPEAANVSNLQTAISQYGIKVDDSAKVKITKANCTSLTINTDTSAQTKTAEISCRIQSSSNNNAERRRIIQQDTSNSENENRDRSIAEVDLYTDLLRSLF